VSRSERLRALVKQDGMTLPKTDRRIDGPDEP
jgi:hypothetical protein